VSSLTEAPSIDIWQPMTQALCLFVIYVAKLSIVQIMWKVTKKQVHSSAPQQLNLSSTCVAFDVNEMHSQDDVPGMSKVKKGKKKRKKTSSEDENLNAVPILMSMAEQAAKPKTLSLLKEATTLMETDLLPQEEVTEDLPSPSNLGNEIINLIGESSDEDAPFTDDDTGSDRLEFFSDSEFQE